MLPRAPILACCSRLAFGPTRAVSTKYPRPHPRPYKRRLFEAAVAPVMPESRKTCVSRVELAEKYRKEREEYSDIELALTDLVRSWIKREGFRVMAICQFLPVTGRTLWLAKNQLRLKGLEFRFYGNRIMKKLFEGTPLQSLNVIFTGPNCYLFGKDIEAIKTVVSESSKYQWMVPLAITYDSRIVSMNEAKELCQRKSLEDLRAETVHYLSAVPAEMVASVNYQMEQLSAILTSLHNRKTADS